MQVKKGENGTQKMLEYLGKKENLRKKYVSNVEKAIKQSTKEKQGFVPITASRNGEETQGLMTLRKRARLVEWVLQLINTQKQGSAQKNVHVVYDIEVEGVHEYFANGLLVSNSIDMARYAMSLQITQTRVEKRKSKFKVRVIPTVNRWSKR